MLNTQHCTEIYRNNTTSKYKLKGVYTVKASPKKISYAISFLLHIQQI